MKSLARARQSLLLIAVLIFGPTLLLGKVTGSISGTARDAQGAVVPGVTVSAKNTQTGVVETIQTDNVGFYSFSALPVGTYDVSFQKTGFKEYHETGVLINVDTAQTVDAALIVGAEREEVTVHAAAAQVDTQTQQTGEVVESREMEDLPLNGRSFTDLLALQPGVVPFNLSQYGSLSPDNSLTNGILAMSGQRQEQNGFMVNGANTVEGDEGGTTIVPNLDSISEFRIILSNAGAEYGNYSGGQVNVVTKSGTNQFHGDAFEFVRNSDFDARNFYSADRGVLHQNMFGGTLGGPILKDKVFFFVDYQGMRRVVGVDTGLIQVPSQADKQGNVLDQAATITATTAQKPQCEYGERPVYVRLALHQIGIRRHLRLKRTSRLPAPLIANVCFPVSRFQRRPGTRPARRRWRSFRIPIKGFSTPLPVFQTFYRMTRGALVSTPTPRLAWSPATGITIPGWTSRPMLRLVAARSPVFLSRP